MLQFIKLYILDYPGGSLIVRPEKLKLLHKKLFTEETQKIVSKKTAKAQKLLMAGLQTQTENTKII